MKRPVYAATKAWTRGGDRPAEGQTDCNIKAMSHELHTDPNSTSGRDARDACFPPESDQRVSL